MKHIYHKTYLVNNMTQVIPLQSTSSHSSPYYLHGFNEYFIVERNQLDLTNFLHKICKNLYIFCSFSFSLSRPNDGQTGCHICVVPTDFFLFILLLYNVATLLKKFITHNLKFLKGSFSVQIFK